MPLYLSLSGGTDWGQTVGRPTNGCKSIRTNAEGEIVPSIPRPSTSIRRGREVCAAGDSGSGPGRRGCLARSPRRTSRTDRSVAGATNSARAARGRAKSSDEAAGHPWRLATKCPIPPNREIRHEARHLTGGASGAPRKTKRRIRRCDLSRCRQRGARSPPRAPGLLRRP